MDEEVDNLSRPTTDGMPQSDDLTPQIMPHQVTVAPDGVEEPAFDDDAASTIVRMDYARAAAYLDQNSWLAEWQYIDYLYQSPNFDRDNLANNQMARISRFNIAKNRNTMSTQVRRGIFGDDNPFLLEARGPLSDDPGQQMYLDAWTELFSVLSERADFEYNMRLFIECQVLQGTGIAIPGWEEKTVIHTRRKRVTPPVEVDMPVGPKKTVDTWESDTFATVEEKVTESWPFFEYRRLGTTLFDEKWRTPNRPELSASYKIDIDYVTMQDLQQMRQLDCYKNIPSDEDLKKFFLNNPSGDAMPESTTAGAMNMQSSDVLHASGDNVKTSHDPFERPFMKISRWTAERVVEVLVYQSRYKTIRNDKHTYGDHALGYTANWWNIDNCGYGMGIGRLNAGDQRMDQGVLNEILKMIAYPMNAPLLYQSESGNEPTQNYIMGLGTMWGVQNAPGGDVRKAFAWLDRPNIPKEAWDIYKLGKDGGEDLVGANSTTMQGNLGGPGSSAMRTAAGVNRVGSKADENIADPVDQLEQVMRRWYKFLWRMVQEEMPPTEIRKILSNKFSKAIVKKINPITLLDMDFNIKILCGQKLAAKQAIAQIIPFLLQLLQQPQLLEFMHQKGWTINFLAIEKIFLRVSELRGAEDIIVPLTAAEKQNVQQSNPAMMKAQIEQLLQKQKGDDALKVEQERGKNAQATEVVKAAAQKAVEKTAGGGELDDAEGRLQRNTDISELQAGIPGETND